MVKKRLFPLICSLISSALYANQPVLAVVEENAGHVSFYKARTGKTLGTLEIGFLPHEIAVTQDGKTAYISNFGIRDYDSGSGLPGASISVIDLPNQVEKYRLYTFDAADFKEYEQIDSAPHAVKLRPPFETELFVNTEKGGRLLIFDVNEKAIIKKIPISPNTHNLFFSKDGNTLWLMAGKDGVVRMNPDSGEITGTFTLSTPVRGLKYTPDGRSLMVSAVNEIVFINPETLAVQKRFDHLNVGPILYSDMTPDQKYILAPAAFDHQVLVIDVNSGQVVKRLVTGLNPINVLISSNGQFAYVSNATDKHLTKIDLQTFAVSSISTQEGPNGLAFLSDKFKTKPHQTLRLGVALPMSGANGPKGREMMRGYEYWKSTVMKAGGLFVNGEVYDVQIIYLDTESNLEKVNLLTTTLLNQYNVNILLSTYGYEAYGIEEKIAKAAHVLLTPSLGQDLPWEPNDLARGYDYFVTSHLYEKGYIQQYNFKPTAVSAQATVMGLLLQNTVQFVNSFDYEKVNLVLKDNPFKLFYSIT